MLERVTSFSRIKNLYAIHVNASITVKLLRRIFSRNGGKLETSEGYTCLFIVSYVLEAIKSLAKK